MGLRLDLDGHEMQFSGPAWRWDMTWMEVRRIYRDLHWDELRPGWMWDVNITPGLYNLDLTSIQVTNHLYQSSKTASQFHPVPISMPSRSHLSPSPISNTSGFLPQLYTRIIWFSSWSLDYRLSSIHFTSHLHPSTDIRFSPPSRLGITSIQLS